MSISRPPGAAASWTSPPTSIEAACRPAQAARRSHHQPLVLRIGAGCRELDVDSRRIGMARRAQGQTHMIFRVAAAQGVAQIGEYVDILGGGNTGIREELQRLVDGVRAVVVELSPAEAAQRLPVPPTPEAVVGHANMDDAPQLPGAQHFPHLFKTLLKAPVLKGGQKDGAAWRVTPQHHARRS